LEHLATSADLVASAGLAAPVEVGRTSSALLVEVHRPLAVLLEVRRCSGLVRRKDLEGVADLAASLVPRRIDSAAASAVLPCRRCRRRRLGLPRLSR